jgi:hypothetical protein
LCRLAEACVRTLASTSRGSACWWTGAEAGQIEGVPEGVYTANVVYLEVLGRDGQQCPWGCCSRACVRVCVCVCVCE